MAYRSHAILVITALLGIGAVYGTSTTTVTLGVSMPSACPLVTINSSLTESCGVACTISGDLDQTVTQRDTLAVVFSTSLDIIGGSSTRYVQSSTVEDLTIQTEAISSDYSWLTEAYTGFTYTPKLDSYASCGTTGTNCTFAFYAIDPSTETTTEAKACRFSMVVSINPITLPNITSSQLYADFSGAPFSASKAPLALLVLLAVPALFFLAL